MDDKRRCKYPECETLLRRGNTGDYCSLHEDKQYFQDVEPKPMRKDSIPAKEKMYTVQDLVMILRLSDKSIRKMLNRGEIAGVRAGQRGRWLISKSEVNRFKKEGPSIAPKVRELLSADEIRQHDITIFQKGDSIMSEVQVRSILSRIMHEQRYGAIDFSMIFDFLCFFHLRGNNYINEKLRNTRDKLWDSFEELNLFMQLNFEILKRRGFLHDEIRILSYHPDVHGIEKIRKWEEREEKLKQVIESAEVIYNEYRDTVKTVLGI
ncbi:MAG: helix-turn-helix domain-containing protein [Dehalococcoidales bacterium]